MNEPGMCKSTIGYRSSLGLKFYVTKDNLDLSWKIKLKRGNIKFRYDRAEFDTAVPTDRAGPIIFRDGFEYRQVQGFFYFHFKDWQWTLAKLQVKTLKITHERDLVQ